MYMCVYVSVSVRCDCVCVCMSVSVRVHVWKPKVSSRFMKSHPFHLIVDREHLMGLELPRKLCQLDS